MAKQQQKRVTVKLYHPEPYQQQVLDGLFAHWEDAVHVVKAVRQCGKSMMLENLLIKVSLLHGMQTSVLISPTFKQGKKIYKSILRKFRRTPLYGSSDGQDLVFTFVNGSEIKFLSAEQGDNIRGETVSRYGVLAIDEAAYIKDEVFYAATPFTNAQRPPTIIVSTPRFKSGFFFDLYEEGLRGEKNIHSYDFSAYPNPYITKDKLELFRNKMPLNLFRADYLGQWMEALSDVFGDFKKVISNSVTLGGALTGGIDWGVGKGAQSEDSDSTALALFNDMRQQVRLYHFNDLDAVTTVQKLAQAIKENGVTKVVVETNSIGGVYLELLRRSLREGGVSCQVVAFTTSNDSKRRVIEDFVVQVQNRDCQLLDDPEQSIQMSAYRIEKTPTGKITYNATPGYHDDCIIADALALNGLKTGTYYIS